MTDASRVPEGLTAAALAADLGEVVAGEVRFDEASRALYATDGSNYRQVPIGVVLPRSADDLERALAVCRRHRAPVLARGAGTSLAGQCCNVAVVIDTSKYLNRVLSVDPQRRIAMAEPGCISDDVREAAAAYGLTFGPDPSTHTHNTIGGMIGNNSCGVHSVRAGRTVDNVHRLEVLTYDGERFWVGPTRTEELEAICRRDDRRGEIYRRLRALRDGYAEEVRARYPQIPRRVSGINLDELLPEKGFNVARALVGTEGTCVFVLQAELALIPDPPARSLLVLGYRDVFESGRHVPEVLAQRPIGLEGIDQALVDYLRRKDMHTETIARLPAGGGWLLAEFGGDDVRQADERAREAMAALGRSGHARGIKHVRDAGEQAALWAVRKSGLGATAWVPGQRNTWPGWEDSAVPADRLGDYLQAFRDLLDRYGYGCSLYGHFGDGCVHVRIDFELTTAEGIEHYKRFTAEAADLVIAFGGSLSGEHGDGQARADLLPRMYGETLVQAFREFKAIWDPDGMMNPGKLIDPAPRDRHLRLGTNYRPYVPATFLDYRQEGDFPQAALRCVGVGKCRDVHSGTMCPSYMGSREEAYSTRGRARLLFELLQGDPLRGGWRDEGVRDALDLCLGCKACKNECPVNVDMATYKAEFMAHHYAHRRRPRQAWVFGLIDRWAALGSRAPSLANLAVRTPGVAHLGKAAVGIAQRRTLPRLARRSFTGELQRRSVPAGEGPRVMLWADTFHQYFRPRPALAAHRLLRAAGYRVEVPDARLCCGRPLYDFGWLTEAKRRLEAILAALRPAVREGVPLVVIEPSCASVFRDELRRQLPADEDAKRLAWQTFTLGELLVNKTDWRPPTLAGSALAHVHCHHRAVLGTQAEAELYRRMGMDCKILDAGCCGMAGAFGFERHKYELSQRIGERRLFPAVREADLQTHLIADGFSCWQQIGQATGRWPRHTAELVAEAVASAPRPD